MLKTVRLKDLLVNFLLSITAISLVLVLLEFALRFPQLLIRIIPYGTPLHIVCNDCPFLYQLNPDHPEVSSQGLRDQEFVIPKPKNSLRILVLGDSVTYGLSVSRDSTFASRLESKLDEEFGEVEVINTGVNGYTPYNELQYYLAKGRDFQPDVVVVAFVMNDVVNPRLHWNNTKETISNIPEEAIPNLDYDRNHGLPLTKSALCRFIWLKLHQKELGQGKCSRESGRDWSTCITGEDTINIKVLLNYDSPEWLWLKSMYDQLNTAVVNDSATFVVVVFPLAYQLEKDYPYMPQELMHRYCKENSLLCLDLLPAFLEHRDEKLYLDNDIWHLNERGHKLVAEKLENFLVKHDLLGVRSEVYSFDFD